MSLAAAGGIGPSPCAVLVPCSILVITNLTLTQVATSLVLTTCSKQGSLLSLNLQTPHRWSDRTATQPANKCVWMSRKPQSAPDTLKYSLVLTVVEEWGGADLSDGAFQLEAERVAAAGVHAGRTSSVVLQLHSVEVWGTALRTRTTTSLLETTACRLWTASQDVSLSFYLKTVPEELQLQFEFD